MAQTTKHPVDDEADVQDSARSVDAVSDIEIQRQFNDLRGEYLDDRADSLNQWLVIIGLILAFFAVAIPIVTGITAYIAYTQFQRIESEAAEHLNQARKHANEAAQYLKDIQAQKKIAEEVVSELSSRDISKLVQPGKSETSLEVRSSLQKIQKIQQNPGASVIDKAIVDAFRFQQEGKVDDAIKKWSSIANISEGIDNDIAAGAFFARGVINNNLNKHDEAISDFNEAIRLNPNFAETYVLRGLANSNSGKHDEAISDFNEAIRLNPSFDAAYMGRGLANSNSGKHDEAISDFNEAIRLNPSFADAYLFRGLTKKALGKVEEAKVDYQMALKLAEQQENEHLKPTIEGILQEFKDQE